MAKEKEGNDMGKFWTKEDTKEGLKNTAKMFAGFALIALANSDAAKKAQKEAEELEKQRKKEEKRRKRW